MQPMFFISGTMCTVDLWQFVFPCLKNNIPVHIDISSATSFNEINKIILSKIEEPAILVGFSLGGFSALNFAVHYPEKIKKLIVIATNTAGLSEKEILLRNSTIDFLEKHSYKGISKQRIQQFLHPNNYKNEAIISIIKKMDSELGKEVLIRQLKATSTRANLSELVCELQLPIVFIAAKNDLLVDAEVLKNFTKKIPKASYICIENSGHMIPLEQPKELCGILNLI